MLCPGVIEAFGIAPQCGLGRTSAESAGSVLRISSEISRGASSKKVLVKAEVAVSGEVEVVVQGVSGL